MMTIDASTTATGMAIFDNAVYQDVISLDLDDKKTGKKTIMETRFPIMAKWMYENVISYKPDIIYIEETVVQRNAEEQRFLTRLQGVIYVYCMEHDCEFNTIRPTEWRKYAGIDQGKKQRKELKAAALELVKTKYGLIVTEDEAEAILIGYAVINKFEELEEIIKKKAGIR
jgi:Holliday junction resolvasome RuvABC endonuclease subunit